MLSRKSILNQNVTKHWFNRNYQIWKHLRKKTFSHKIAVLNFYFQWYVSHKIKGCNGL